MKNQKLLKYSSAVGALLAVTGTAKANIAPGEIMLNYQPPTAPPEINFDGDEFLNHTSDYVFIDMDHDGHPDFIAVMFLNSGQNPSDPLFDNPYYSAFVLIGSYGYGNNSAFVDLNYSFSTNSLSPAPGPIYPFINNFANGENIGPLDYPNDVGLLTFFSNQGDNAPQGTGPQPIPFNPFGDQGYVGVSMPNGSGFNYGYIQVDIDVNSQSVEFISCALEQSLGTPIAAGAAPNVPLLPIASATGLGLIGLMAAMRKRKKSKA